MLCIHGEGLLSKFVTFRLVKINICISEVLLRAHWEISKTATLSLFRVDLWSMTRQVCTVEKQLEKFLKFLVRIDSLKFFKSLFSITYSDRAWIHSFVQDFRFPLANTSRYLYSELSCLSSRCKPSLPVEARAQYEWYKHELEGTVSKYSHVLNGQLAIQGGRGEGKEVLLRPKFLGEKNFQVWV